MARSRRARLSCSSSGISKPLKRQNSGIEIFYRGPMVLGILLDGKRKWAHSEDGLVFLHSRSQRLRTRFYRNPVPPDLSPGGDGRGGVSHDARKPLRSAAERRRNRRRGGTSRFLEGDCELLPARGPHRSALGTSRASAGAQAPSPEGGNG